MDRIKFRTWTIPLALLILCGISFGLLIPWLGYYWDDWPVILMTRLKDARSFWDFYQYDRPISAWTYIVSTPLLGTNIISWHIFTLLLRWLTVLGMWWSLSALWPQHKRKVTWMAFLFAVYPVFTQQPTSVAFSQHWTCYALYFLSLAAMIQAFRKPRWLWPLTVFSLFTALLDLATMEYFLGLELLRPLILWFLVSENQSNTRQRIVKTLQLWLPYFLALAAFVVWRVFFLKLAGEDPNKPELLFTLASQPLSALLNLLQSAIQDTAHILFAAWFPTLDPTALSLSDRFELATWVIALVTAGALFFYLNHLKFADKPEEEYPPSPGDKWLAQAILLGSLATVLGPLPVWITGKQVIYGLYSNRFALASMSGASILIVGLIEWFTPRRLAKALLLAILVGLSVGFHLRSANEYRWIWTKQTRFYWQLYWRAPYLSPDTAVFSEGELFKYVGAYSTASGVNLLYPQPPGSATLGYWFIDLYRNYTQNIRGLLKGIKIKQSFRTFEFTGSSLNSILISYEPEAGNCLWVLDPKDSNDPNLTDLSKQVLPLSNLARIQADAPQTGYPPTSIFGPEPERTWCYYYEKAELASQEADWDTITQLGDEAMKLGHRPNNVREWLPFIEGFAHTGELQKAEMLTLDSKQTQPGLTIELCNLWGRISESSPQTPGLADSAARIISQLGCEQ